jgi:hypothetical protein
LPHLTHLMQRGASADISPLTNQSHRCRFYRIDEAPSGNV